MQLSLWDCAYENMLRTVSDRIRLNARIKVLADDYRREKAIRDAVPVALYRHFDAEGRLLYVGISKMPERRLDQHRLYSQWFHLMHSTTVEWIDGLAAALSAERVAILNEAPIYNKAGVSCSMALPLTGAKGNGKGGKK